MSSSSRRVQCPHCAELFPFECAVSGRNLRPPLTEFDDERHLTWGRADVEARSLKLSPRAHEFITDDPLPLSEEHRFRSCPDCATWFLASENEGYYRCAACQTRFDSANSAAFETGTATETMARTQTARFRSPLAEKTADGVAVASGSASHGSASGSKAMIAVIALVLLGLLVWFLMQAR